MSDVEEKKQVEEPRKKPYNLREKKNKDAAYRSLIRPELADELYDQIRNLPGSLMYMPLSTSAENNTSERNCRWKININVQIEQDDL